MLPLPTRTAANSPPPPSPPPPPFNSIHLSPPTMPIKAEEPRDKKPRIRHTEAQLAALNDLYEENEHPSLDERADLADRLGMEPKAVNAWFANKRSATKKKTRGSNPPYSTPPPNVVSKADDDDNNSVPYDLPSRLSTPLGSVDFQTFPAMDPESRHVFDSEISSAGIQRRMRIRPTPNQTQELRRLYNVSTHPSREEREALGDRIGMKYQSVTNWFQNQRSLARKREEQELETHSVHSNDMDESGMPPRPESRPYHSFPPATAHPSLASSVGPSRGPSMPPQVPTPRSYSDSQVPPHTHEPKLTTVRRLIHNTPLSRPRRTRPEPYQLEALKKLFARTPNPSIEERGALALEIGMELGKVTNWFRNLRQTARKRAAKSHNNDGDDEGMDYDESAPVSQLGTPMFHAQSSYSSSAASVDGDVEHMDLDGHIDHVPPHSLSHHHPHAPHSHPHHHHHSDGSEEEDQEAVTPPPAAPRAAGRRRMDVGFLTSSSDDLHLPPPPAKQFGANAHVPVERPRMEDALLLLSFSQRVAN